jgi:hypothetical protein
VGCWLGERLGELIEVQLGRQVGRDGELEEGEG